MNIIKHVTIIVFFKRKYCDNQCFFRITKLIKAKHTDAISIKNEGINNTDRIPTLIYIIVVVIYNIQYMK